MPEKLSSAEAERSAKEALANHIRLEEVTIDDIGAYSKTIGSETHHIYRYSFAGGGPDLLDDGDYIAVSKTTGEVEYIGKQYFPRKANPTTAHAADDAGGDWNIPAFLRSTAEN